MRGGPLDLPRKVAVQRGMLEERSDIVMKKCGGQVGIWRKNHRDNLIRGASNDEKLKWKPRATVLAR